MQDGLYRMYEKKEKIFYYITTMNENYSHHAMPEGAEEGIRRGMYSLKVVGTATKNNDNCVQLLGCGTILLQVEKAANWLAEKGICSQVWSVTSFNELRRDGLGCERQDYLSAGESMEEPYVTRQLKNTSGPIIASTDYMKTYADQIRPYIPLERDYKVLGTDGFGRSDTRENLRHFFEVDWQHIAWAALYELKKQGKITPEVLDQAQQELDINSAKLDPLYS
jgi:pyruvate dehydrogenase E1 component